MTHPIITGHAPVRAALRDPSRYSSDLQGDRDVRTYKQLPLEVDPPIHADYRAILTPLFSADRVASLAPKFRVAADALLAELADRESFDVPSDLALEMVVRCLGVVFERPGDVDEWRSWGPDVWITTETGRSGTHLQAYLERTFADVAENPGSDAFSVIDQATLNGRALTVEEKHGIANIILAGGRDTVVKLMTGFMWYLGHNHEQRQALAEDRTKIARAIDELVRWLSPLPMMERIDTHAPKGDEPAYTFVSFVSANHDPSVFAGAGTIDVGRHPNPHMGFGGGPHACIGNQVAKAETRALLESLFDAGRMWHIVDEEIDWVDIHDSRIPGRFHRVTAAWAV
jgi:cytochrome P450